MRSNSPNLGCGLRSTAVDDSGLPCHLPLSDDDNRLRSSASMPEGSGGRRWRRK